MLTAAFFITVNEPSAVQFDYETIDGELSFDSTEAYLKTDTFRSANVAYRKWVYQLLLCNYLPTRNSLFRRSAQNGT
jgi:hypothetical protein